MEEFGFKSNSEKRRENLELMIETLELIIAKLKLLHEKPRIARRYSTTGCPSNSSLPIYNSSKSQISRRQSTADLPSKALWSKPQYKPASLVGITPEIRLMIYDHILLPSEFDVMCSSCHPSKCCLELPERCATNNLSRKTFKSPLLRVHPRIYREVKELLWNRAIFGLGCINNAHKSLVSMSWISRRLIRNIEITLQFDCRFQIDLSNMSKSISTMNAMARDGLLQSITIIIPPFQLKLILEEKLNGKFQFDQLRSLGSARTWSCKMIIRILYSESYIDLLDHICMPLKYNFRNIPKEKIIQIYKDLFEELNQAWGGSLYLADTLVWENGRHVYRAPPARVGAPKPLFEFIKRIQ
ncbi:uncharacterized protein EAE98_009698 [Botrytis deweyae]|uniref:Uncharacterized protein n=1 Tax=Botrytis deweyae TaxID=2478750 RepID=A0ABQ7IAZ8_9HELO|nr:uncharacterized protein EAE98_009698 [Botrytis deweyae]KAF7918455.1 hypothetical protein EAE98_009698 [Botrytis deweyae]